MHLTLTGSLGHVGQPLTETLVAAGHRVTVISSSAERRAPVEALGARAAIGTWQDVDFLTERFRGADVVYTMVPPANYWDPSLDLLAYFETIGGHYAEAIRRSGVTRVVNLSSIGAHMQKGNGILEGTYYVEQILNALPEEVSITHIRPTEFYYNLLPFVHAIRASGQIATVAEPDDVNVWVAPSDIAASVAEAIADTSGRRKVRYVASEEITYGELARTLGTAIGKPDLQWVTIGGEEMEAGLVAVGMQAAVAAGMVEMYTAIHTGALYEDYREHRPERFGEVKASDFAVGFAEAYKNQ